MVLSDPDDDPGIAATVISCQGPPACSGKSDIEMDTCPLCTRIHVLDDGTEVEVPGASLQ